MKCPNCGENSLIGWEYQLIDGNRRFTDFFFVGVILERCPCGFSRLSDIHLVIPFFPHLLFYWKGFLKI